MLKQVARKLSNKGFDVSTIEALGVIEVDGASRVEVGANLNELLDVNGLDMDFSLRETKNGVNILVHKE